MTHKTHATVRGSALPQPITLRCREHQLDDLLSREWLLSNRIGAYASSSVVGCNTRRYHALLVAATMPPVGRMVALSQVADQLQVGGQTHDLATIEFPDVIAPRGFERLEEFRNDVTPTFVFRIGGLEVVKRILLAEAANAVTVRYTLRGGRAALRVQPLVALRDFHQLRSKQAPHQMTFESADGGLTVHDRSGGAPPVYLLGAGGQFQADGQWWYRFHYRVDLARGQDAFEDLYTPGTFVFQLDDGQSCELSAGLGEPPRIDFDSAVMTRRTRLEDLAASLGPDADETQRRLAAASDAYVVQRHFPNAAPSWTVLAGFPWFADWGRDTFIALPGLLLETGRFAQARGVFRTFAGRISEGMVPNRFDDYSNNAHYNSIDASLWFIIASERYLAATGDVGFWRDELMPAAQAILRAYQEGARFEIHADADGLLTGGSYRTQLTWMDAALGEEVVTPRHGKAVEINALWHSAHRLLASRCRGIDETFADTCEARAGLIAAAFERTFWNDQAGCLYDCISGSDRDGSIRPNQIFAVSLPHSPLSPARQAAVVGVVRAKLLTPLGLRTLSPEDPRYRRRYGGSWESRDRAYHQGTVWAWLIGPFIEAYLRVEGRSARALDQARQWLAAFDEHLRQAGIGHVSEIFDADEPHTPRGCFAQAWSVAEVLRAKRLVDSAGRDGRHEESP